MTSHEWISETRYVSAVGVLLRLLASITRLFGRFACPFYNMGRKASCVDVCCDSDEELE